MITASQTAKQVSEKADLEKQEIASREPEKLPSEDDCTPVDTAKYKHTTGKASRLGEGDSDGKDEWVPSPKERVRSRNSARSLRKGSKKRNQ
jgi:hypothetical protein